MRHSFAPLTDYCISLLSNLDQQIQEIVTRYVLDIRDLIVLLIAGQKNISIFLTTGENDFFSIRDDKLAIV